MSGSTSAAVSAVAGRAVLPRTGRLFVISSPSGGGKTTLLRGLLRRARGLVRSVSVTTRAPRAGERRNRDYLFVSTAAFHRLRRGGELLEWARVHGAYYGTPKRPVLSALSQGRHVVLCIDVQGARKVRRLLGRRAVLIFLLPPSWEQLRHRLVSRRTETAATLQRRLAAARREVASASWYDYRVVNDRLARAVATVERIIAERSTAWGDSSRHRRDEHDSAD